MKKNKSLKKILIIFAWIAGIAGILAAAVVWTMVSRAPRQGEIIELQGRDHIPSNTEVTINYNSNPPTSGPHTANAARWGFYDIELDDAQLVHNLEHGGIWISFKEANDDELNKLKEFSRRHPESVIVTRRSKNDSRFAIASWGRLMKSESLDMEAVRKFYKGNKNKSPEPLAGD